MADQRMRNHFILETLEQAYNLAQPIDAYVGKVHGNAIAPHTYVNFDQLFEWRMSMRRITVQKAHATV